MVQKNKFEAYIGFSIKSGKTIFGYDKIVECKKKIAMIIFDESTNVKIVNKLISFCEDCTPNGDLRSLSSQGRLSRERR